MIIIEWNKIARNLRLQFREGLNEDWRWLLGQAGSCVLMREEKSEQKGWKEYENENKQSTVEYGIYSYRTRRGVCEV